MTILCYGLDYFVFGSFLPQRKCLLHQSPLKSYALTGKAQRIIEQPLFVVFVVFACHGVNAEREAGWLKKTHQKVELLATNAASRLTQMLQIELSTGEGIRECLMVIQFNPELFTQHIQTTWLESFGPVDSDGTHPALR